MLLRRSCNQLLFVFAACHIAALFVCTHAASVLPVELSDIPLYSRSSSLTSAGGYAAGSEIKAGERLLPTAVADAIEHSMPGFPCCNDVLPQNGEHSEALPRDVDHSSLSALLPAPARFLVAGYEFAALNGDLVPAHAPAEPQPGFFLPDDRQLPEQFPG